MAIRRPAGTTIRRLPVGAEVQTNGQTHFRLWSPDHCKIELVLEASPNSDDQPRALLMTREEGDYFSLCARATAGTLYRFRLDDGPRLPDPASRFQPLGPEGPSEVIDPASFSWTDDIWKGVLLPGQVLYEMHVGTFTPEGTWVAAARELAELARLGVTLLEIMPVADWPGQFGWGYDGVCVFAPTRLYGTPDDFRHFVDQAHRVGIGVLLDVVYNHFGNHGCSVQQFSRNYVADVHANEWGAPVNFDGPGSGPVREFFLANARYWIEEFHLDGYRVDATQAIFDDSPEHAILGQVTAYRPAAQPRREAIDRHAGRERTARYADRSADCRRRVRHGGVVERRLSPLRHGATYWIERSLLFRLLGLGQRVYRIVEMGISLPGTVLFLAEEPPRHAGLRSPTARVRTLFAESRPGGQLGQRRQDRPIDQSGPPASHDGSAAVDAGDAALVSGAGVRRLHAVLFFLGQFAGPGAASCCGACPVSVAVPFAGTSRSATAPARTGRSADISRVQAEVSRARDARGSICVA